MDEKVNNVEYILLAEFDIDKGSTVKHQYPRECPISTSILADLMLPEGAHLREQDWTIFFLRDSERGDAPVKRRMTRIDMWVQNRTRLIQNISTFITPVQVLEYSDEIQDWYILSDTGRVRFSYSADWGPEDEVFPNIRLKVHESDDVNRVYADAYVDEEMQFTLLSERNLFCSFYPSSGGAIGLRFFEEPPMNEVQNIIYQILEPEVRPTEVEEQPDEPPGLDVPLCVLNYVRTQHDKSVRRGAVVKSMAICTQYQFLESFKPLLIMALDQYFRTESKDELRLLFETLNDAQFNRGANQGMRQIDKYLPTPMGPQADPFDEETETFRVNVQFHRINMHLTVPTQVSPDEITGVSLTAFINKFKRHVPTIYNAVFTQKRVLFLGHNQPAADVCQMVLCACLLVSPALEGTLQRAYPYACLTAMQFLQVPGYIAGVTNPLFEQRNEWWDVCCNIATGEVSTSESYRTVIEENQLEYSKTIGADRLLLNEIRNGIDMKYSDKWVRSALQDYTEHIVRMALALEVFETEEQAQEDWEANKWRIDAWRLTPSFEESKARFENLANQSPFGAKTNQILRIVRTLQMRPVDTEQGRLYFQQLSNSLDTEEKIEYFISELRPSLGGLKPIASYLFHADANIRTYVLDVFSRLERCALGRRMVGSMNFYYVLMYHRMKWETENNENPGAPGADDDEKGE